jgi:hypothetical protein
MENSSIEFGGIHIEQGWRRKTICWFMTTAFVELPTRKK